MNSKSYSATPMEPPSILETVLRVALCQPAICNLTAKSSCVQPLRRRNLMTCCRIKFSFFMATESESHAIRSALFHFETKCSLCFYRKFVGQVVMISLQLLPGMNLVSR